MSEIISVNRDDLLDLLRSRQYIYGLSELCTLLRCSHPTAYKLKRDKLDGCYLRTGRKLVFDVQKVLHRLGLED